MVYIEDRFCRLECLVTHAKGCETIKKVLLCTIMHVCKLDYRCTRTDEYLYSCFNTATRRKIYNCYLNVASCVSVSIGTCKDNAIGCQEVFKLN